MPPNPPLSQAPHLRRGALSRADTITPTERELKMLKSLRTPAILALAIAPLAVSAQELSEARIKELVYEAILENPGIVMEAVRLLEQRNQEEQNAAAATALGSMGDKLNHDPNAPVLGNPDGDVTVVEFFDYNCPYCRRAMPEVDALIAQDENVRVV